MQPVTERPAENTLEQAKPSPKSRPLVIRVFVASLPLLSLVPQLTTPASLARRADFLYTSKNKLQKAAVLVIAVVLLVNPPIGLLVIRINNIAQHSWAIYSAKTRYMRAKGACKLYGATLLFVSKYALPELALPATIMQAAMYTLKPLDLRHNKDKADPVEATGQCLYGIARLSMIANSVLRGSPLDPSEFEEQCLAV